jgi:hypothetical protein
MAFTPLHRLLGLSPGELNDDIIEAAVAAQVEETDDLDWKSKLPEAKGITNGEFPKDIAAMANSGGGVIPQVTTARYGFRCVRPGRVVGIMRAEERGGIRQLLSPRRTAKTLPPSRGGAW